MLQTAWAAALACSNDADRSAARRACLFQSAAEPGEVGESQEAGLRDNGVGPAGEIRSLKLVQRLIEERSLQLFRKPCEPRGYLFA